MTSFSTSALGLMSGSSLDGLDMAHCSFTYVNNTWHFTLDQAETIPYPCYWKTQLKEAKHLSTDELKVMNLTYGKYLGELAAVFIKKHKLSPDLIASHGHTVFHCPEKGYSLQIGEGKQISYQTKIPTISNFRNGDILNGGQGAPLVPIGDQLLFSNYIACLNLGGIANISYLNKNRRVGYDICGANQLLNMLSQQMGLAYDEGGKIAASGNVIRSLLNQLNQDPYLTKEPPKSLSNQYVTDNFTNTLLTYHASVADRLATAVEHIAFQINKSVQTLNPGQVLVTGGGAHNHFLLNTLNSISPHTFIVPHQKLVDFKEALIFAFMGVLRLHDKVNCLASVTGATKDTSSGIIHLP